MSVITVPFSWLLLTFYNFTGNYGVAIILFAVIVKLILLPFQMKSKKSMVRMGRLQPRMNEIQKKFEDNKAKQQEEIARVYKEAKVNPMSGCIWSLIPFPILIALYSVIRQPLTTLMGLTAEQISTVVTTFENMGLYSSAAASTAYSELPLTNLIHQNFGAIKAVVPQVLDINFNFLGLNLGEFPSWNFFMNADWGNTAQWLPQLGLFMIPVISALMSYLSMKITQRDAVATEQTQTTGKTMNIIMPLVSLYICFTMPAALGVYWIANSTLAFVQELILGDIYKKQMDKEDADWLESERIREEELERKRQETERLKAEGKTIINPNTSRKKIQGVERAENDKRIAAERAAEKAARKAALGIQDDIPDSQVGNRRFARGRAYVDDRFINPDGADEATAEAAAASEIADAAESDEKTDKENSLLLDTQEAEAVELDDESDESGDSDQEETDEE